MHRYISCVEHKNVLRVCLCLSSVCMWVCTDMQIYRARHARAKAWHVCMYVRTYVCTCACVCVSFTAAFTSRAVGTNVELHVRMWYLCLVFVHSCVCVFLLSCATQHEPSSRAYYIELPRAATARFGPTSPVLPGAIRIRA